MTNLPTKTVHKGHLVNDKGQVSALCYEKPRQINLKREGYVFAPENDQAVSCTKCLKLMNERRSK